MARKSSSRVVRAIADAMWKRDQLQMRAVEALLSTVEPQRQRRAKPKTRRRPAGKARR